MSITPYTAAYVRALSVDKRLRSQVSVQLAKGKAWEIEERLVVCMVDISGYSKMSAGLTYLGKMASEVITKTVGSFLSKIIDVIALYGGDIVRFLGDAVLVAFSPNTGEKDLSQAVLRSLACCLHVATFCKSVDLDMSLAANSQNPNHKRDPRLAEPTATMFSLYLHFAITAGPMSRVILGDPAYRLDYCVQGPGMRALGAILDNTACGELGLSEDALAEMNGALRAEVECRRKDKRVGGHGLLSSPAVAALTMIVFGTDAGVVANMNDAEVAEMFWAGSGMRRSRGPSPPAVSSFPVLPGAIRDNDNEAGGEEFVRRFVNHSLLKRIDAYKSRAVQRSSGTAGRLSTVKGARMSSVASEGQDTNANGMEHGALPQHGSVDAFAEFRSVATIFVAITFPFELDMVQKILLSFLRALKEHKGVFLQYSGLVQLTISILAADDKGQTMLAIFGLPSFSHVNNSDQSAKCMKWFIDDLSKILNGPFIDYISISIASGEILFTKLGNEYRSEVGLLGDVIVTAARLMPISGSKRAIVIDQDTYDNIKLTHATSDLGMVHLKGRANDSRIYALVLDEAGDSSGASRPMTPHFGYERERAVLTERFSSWREEGKRAVVIIEAQSGLGKSTLATFLMEHANDRGVPTCLIQGSEMDQWRPFCGLEPLLVFIFNNLYTAPSAVKLGRSANRSNSFSTVSRLPSRRSMRRQSTADTSNASQVGGVLGLASQAFLMRAGVDLAHAPLLGLVSTGFAAKDTKATKAMEASAKINHLKSIVARIVTAFVRDFKAVFLFDDAQWFDSHSLDVLLTLARYCPKILLLILSRPIALSENRALERALAFPDTSHLKLSGFSEQEAADLILSKLTILTVHVDHVDPIITAAIFAKTSGSPLFLQMIIDVLFMKVGGELIVDGNGVLTLRDECVRVDTILTDLGAAILFQFDRLNATFQRVLKVACVLGQYFNLRSVLDLENVDMNVAECAELIKDCDVYKFLVCELPCASSTPKNPDSPPTLESVECSFRHISIMNAIYDSLSFEERLAANASVGEMIENLTNDANRAELLPSLEYHFSRAGDVERTISYKEELGILLMSKSQCVEGVRILESLVTYVAEANPKDLEKLPEPVTALRKAKWFERMCSGYSTNRTFPKERDSGILALNLLAAEPWPDGDKEIKRALRNEGRRFCINWILTLGGKLKAKPSNWTSPRAASNMFGTKAQRVEMEKAVLFSMAESLGLDKAFSAEERVYLVLRHCNLLIRNNNSPVDWTAILYKVAFYGVFIKPKYYSFFMRAAAASDKGCDRPSHLFVKGLNKPFWPTYKECVPIMLEVHAMSNSQCDTYFANFSIGFATGVAFQYGDFKTVDDVSAPYFRTSLTLKDDIFLSFLVVYPAYRLALARGDVAAMAEWQPAFESRAAILRLFSFALESAESMQCMLAAQRGDFDGALGHLVEYHIILSKLAVNGDIMDTTLFMPYPILLIFDPTRSGVLMTSGKSDGANSPAPWSFENVIRLKTIISSLKVIMKTLGVVHHHVASFWTIEIFESAELLLEGRTNDGVSVAKRKLRNKRKAELDGIPCLKAMFHGIIAKYSTSKQEAATSRESPTSDRIEMMAAQLHSRRPDSPAGPTACAIVGKSCKSAEGTGDPSRPSHTAISCMQKRQRGFTQDLQEIADHIQFGTADRCSSSLAFPRHMSVAPYTAAYVRALAADRGLRAQVAARLAKGRGWEMEERLVVCMVDISGYSKLSAGLTFLGKMASEVITKTVGSFLNKIIDVIALYRGDIVRFLGDALLVAFSPEPGERDLSQAVLRSLACCLHVATCCKSVDLDMRLASTSQNPGHRHDPLLADLASGNSSMSSLYLHFAITAGPMSRVILGDPAWRLDYCVQGPGLRALGAILDNTARGELGLSADALAELDSELRAEVERRANGARVGGHGLLSRTAVAAMTTVVFGTNAGTVADMADADVAALFWAGSGMRQSRVGPVQRGVLDFPPLPGAFGDGDDDVDAEEFVRRFVNHSLLKRIDAYQLRATPRLSGVGGRTTSVARRVSSVGRRSTSSAVKSSNGSSVADEESGAYASGWGAGTMQQQQGSGSDGFAEFRSVATIFVALIFPFELDMVQKILLSFLRALKEHKGVFLQYSADDKGQTMLAIFGLPSFSHVNNSDQSVKCMKWFVDDLRKILDGPFTNYISISISSGDILFTKLGNEYRSEVGLLGDVIVTAARLMPISGSKLAIVIDQETNDNVKLTHATCDLGMVHLKGRANDCRIHALELDAADGLPGGAAAKRPHFGYKHEREVLTERFASWHTEKRRAVVIIEAPSGQGKSTLGTFLIEHAGAHGVPTCLTQGSEMDQWRPFSGLEPLIVFIFSHLPSPATLQVAPSSLKLASYSIRSGSMSSVSRLPSRLNLRRQSSVFNTSQVGCVLGPAAQAFLVRAGVDFALAPLLGMVSAGFAVEESKMTRALDAQAKINFVKSIVAKIVTAFVKEVAAVFVFDDAQWFDSHTLDILLTLARYCPKIFLQILSRPLSLSENKTLERALAFPDTSHLKLGGFSEQEAADLIMSKLSKLTVPVDRVDPAISAAVFAKTSGSPLFLQMIIDVLFVKVGVDLIVNGDGVLTVRDESVRIDAILTDLSAAILFQFDRLDPTFQRVLKVACVLGQYFNLQNVLDLEDFDMEVAECVELIKDNDVYNFLVCEIPTAEPSPQDPDDSPSSQDFDNSPLPYSAECSFRHISIMNAIYESLSFEERLEANNSVGIMIENVLYDDNRESLLPSLEYHFSRTGDVEKIVGYKEELGLLLMGKFQIVEGLRILESLVNYVSEANPEDLERLPEPITAIRRAKWFERLCSGYSITRSFPKERDAGIVALNYLGAESWPHGDEEIKLALKKMQRRLCINWVLTFGGRLKSKPSSKRTSPDNTPSKAQAIAEIIELEKAVLFSMAEALGLDKAFTGEERLYLVMRHCNLLIRYNYNSEDWTCTLYKVAYYGNLAKLKALVKPCSSTRTECIPLLLKIYAISVSRCDVYFEHFTMNMVAGVSFESGFFKTIDEITEPFYRTSPTVKEDPIISFMILYALYRVALIRGELVAIAEWQQAYDPRSAAARAFNFGIDARECLDAMIAAHKGDIRGALGHMEGYLIAFSKLEVNGDVADTAMFVPYPIILIFDPVRSGLPLAGVESSEHGPATPWTHDEVGRMKAVVVAMKGMMKAFGIVYHHVSSFWIIEIYEAIELLLDGRKKEAITVIKRKLRSRRKSELEGLVSLKAMYHGLIAKYSDCNGDGAKSRAISSNLFNELKSQLYLRWLES